MQYLMGMYQFHLIFTKQQRQFSILITKLMLVTIDLEQKCIQGHFWVKKKKVFNWITNTGYRIFRWQDPLVSKLGLRYLDLFLSSVSDFLHDFGQVSLRFRVVFAMLLKHFLIPQCGDVTCIVLDHRK